MLIEVYGSLLNQEERKQIKGTIDGKRDNRKERLETFFR